MKLKNIFLLMALGAICFTACGDDEPDPKTKQSELNKEVVGVYNGWTHLETNFLNKDYTGDSFTLAQAEDGSLTATFADATWGTATIKGIQAVSAGEDGKYSLTTAEGSFVMNNIRTGEKETFPCKLESAVVTPKAKIMQAVISAYMEVGHGNMTFVFQTGEKLTPAS